MINQHLKQELFFDKYPLCFPSEKHRCSFCTGKGWWPLIDILCASITEELEKELKKKPGVFKLLVKTLLIVLCKIFLVIFPKLPRFLRSTKVYYTINDLYWNSKQKPRNFHVSQIKEKFGTLRFHIGGFSNEKIRSLISRAENISARTCEECGLPGRQGGLSWDLEKKAFQEGRMDRPRFKAIGQAGGLNKWLELPREERDARVHAARGSRD